MRRRAASLLSTLAPSHGPVETVITKLADTERNYILKKGESTPDLKRSEVEGAATVEIIKGISAIVGVAHPTAKSDKDA